MRKRVISILAIAALLVAAIAVPCVADTDYDVPASVTVALYLSITISDNGTAGLDFGNVNPGSTDNPEANSAALSITVDSESNTNVDLQISGTDFDLATFTIDNAKYSTTVDGTKVPMSLVDTDIVGATDMAPGTSIDLWHWLDVPGGVTQGTYGSTFRYSAVVATP